MDKNLKEDLKQHYNNIAPNRSKWYGRNKYYHKHILKYYRFYVQEESTILEMGCGTGNLLGNLRPSRGIGVDISEEMIKIAKRNFPNINFICSDVDNFLINEKFVNIRTNEINIGKISFVLMLSNFSLIRKFSTSEQMKLIL